MDNNFFKPQPLARVSYGNCCKQSINVNKEKMTTNQKQRSARKTFYSKQEGKIYGEEEKKIQLINIITIKKSPV